MFKQKTILYSRIDLSVVKLYKNKLMKNLIIMNEILCFEFASKLN